MAAEKGRAATSNSRTSSPSGSTGTGQHPRTFTGTATPSRNLSIGKVNDRQDKVGKAPSGTAPSSQRSTTPPPVSTPIQMIRDTKSPTPREKAHAQWLRENPSVAGGPQFQTMYEREFEKVAQADKTTGSESVFKGKPKQAQ